MIGDQKVLAIIPARGGSKGIKDKNILKIQGKPMIGYTIEAVKKSAYIDNVVVSTDSEKIKNIAEQYGAWVPFLRPAELATDESSTLSVVLHAVSTLQERGYQYDILILLQPTSPLRRSEDIDAALKIFFENGCQPLASVTETTEHPILMRSIGRDGQLEKMLHVNSSVRRQDMPSYYKINGSIYINLICELNMETSFNDNRIPYFMKAEYAVDIDDDMDVMIADYYLRKEKNKEKR